MQNGLCNYCKSSCHKVALEFFATNAPDPAHWTQNSCFVAFRSVWVHLGPFHCFRILGSKLAELLQLMQKFVPQSRIRIFCNKSTRSTSSDPKLMLVHFVVSGWIWDHFLLNETRCKMGRTGASNAKVRTTNSLQNFSQRMHPMHTLGP